MHILSSLPKHLRNKAISLAGLGVDNYAWPGEAALDVIVSLKQQGLVILGGDVFRGSDSEHIEFTYDNWHSEKEPEWSWHEYVMQSCDHTRSYISAYLERNDQESIAFGFVVVDSERYDELVQSNR